MLPNASEVETRQLEAMLVAALRMTGKYSDAGKGFSLLGKKFGRHICGKPFMLHHGSEHKEDDANFEVCMPIRKGESTGNIEVRELAGGTCISLIHLHLVDPYGAL